MEVTIRTTQLRTNIGALLKQLRDNPGLVYKVTNHNEVVAELRAPHGATPSGTKSSTEQEIVTFIDAYLRGAVPKKKGAYERMGQLCETPSEDLPYKSLDEAMRAIRGRGYVSHQYAL